MSTRCAFPPSRQENVARTGHGGSLRIQGFLLRDGFYGVAGLEAGAGDRGADRGRVVDVGGFDDADGGGEAADDRAGGGVLDLLGDAH